MVFSADFYGFADNSHLLMKRQVGGSNPEIQPQSKINNTRNNVELDKREINGNGITETGFNAEGKGQTNTTVSKLPHASHIFFIQVNNEHTQTFLLASG